VQQDGQERSDEQVTRARVECRIEILLGGAHHELEPRAVQPDGADARGKHGRSPLGPPPQGERKEKAASRSPRDAANLHW